MRSCGIHIKDATKIIRSKCERKNEQRATTLIFQNNHRDNAESASNHGIRLQATPPAIRFLPNSIGHLSMLPTLVFYSA